MDFEYYAPSSELIKQIIPNLEKYREEALKNIGTKEYPPKIKIAEIQGVIGEEIYSLMLWFWKYKKKGEKVPIIQNEDFFPDFQRELKKRLDPDRTFPEEFYSSLSKEMLDYYFVKKNKDKRFEVLVSQEKKDLELLIKNERKDLSSIKEIEADDKWIVT